MLTITARLLHGTIRAGAPTDTVMAGGQPVGEWPPSPARLFSALVAADGTRDRCRMTSGDELRALERCAPPSIHAALDVEETSLNPRFVVKDSTVREKIVQEYPARTSSEVRPGVRLSPRHPEIAYVWDASLPRELLDALAIRAARVGYLGCADSPVLLKVSRSTPEASLPIWQPDASNGMALPVPYDGFTSALDDAYDRWSDGQASRRALIPNQWTRYSVSNDEADLSEPIVLWFDLDRPLPGRRALVLTTTLRKTVLSRLGTTAQEGPGSANVPWIFHGHDIPPDVKRPYQLARFLPLLEVGHTGSSGRIHGAAIWLPPEVPADVVEGLRAVTHRPMQLRGDGADAVLRPHSASTSKWTTNPRRWSQHARRWFSVTPAVAERGRRKGPNIGDVREWFVHAGHPSPVAVRVSPVPTRPTVPRLAGREVHRSDRDRHPYVWFEAEFDEPVAGPLCVGRSRSFGMGLMAPDPREAHNA